MGKIFLSVIIPTYQRDELLLKCLDCLHPDNQSLNVENYEIIVTDDDHSIKLKELLNEKHPWVKLVSGPKKGPGANRNNGAKYASGNWFVFTDDDCLPFSQFLESYYKEIKIKSNINLFEGKTISDRTQMRYNEEAPINEKGGNLWSCNLAVSREYYEKVGGFNESFFFNLEDAEFHVRAKKNGETIPFVDQALVCHPWRKSRSLRKHIEAIKSIEIFLKVCPEQKKYFGIILRLKIWLSGTINGFKYCFKYRFRGFGYMLVTRLIDLYALLRIGIKLNLGLI